MGRGAQGSASLSGAARGRGSLIVRPVHGVQFHPESIATEGGHQMLANFLDLAGVKRLAAA